MLRTPFLVRSASTSAYKGASQVSIPRRPLKKIRLGKARPAIYHQFEVNVELSDGSVIKRRSQYPKNELRLIQDQRNNPLWNPSRDDLIVVDANAGGNLDKFKQKYSSIFSVEMDSISGNENAATEGNTKAEPTKAAREQQGSVEEDTSSFEVEDYLSLLDDSSKQIKTGKLAGKKRAKK